MGAPAVTRLSNAGGAGIRAGRRAILVAVGADDLAMRHVTSLASRIAVLLSDVHASTALQPINAISPGLTCTWPAIRRSYGAGGCADPAGRADIVMKSRPHEGVKKVAGPCMVDASSRWPFLALASPPGCDGS